MATMAATSGMQKSECERDARSISDADDDNKEDNDGSDDDGDDSDNDYDSHDSCVIRTRESMKTHTHFQVCERMGACEHPCTHKHMHASIYIHTYIHIYVGVVQMVWQRARVCM